MYSGVLYKRRTHYIELYLEERIASTSFYIDKTDFFGLTECGIRKNY